MEIPFCQPSNDSKAVLFKQMRILRDSNCRMYDVRSSFFLQPTLIVHTQFNTFNCMGADLSMGTYPHALHVTTICAFRERSFERIN